MGSGKGRARRAASTAAVLQAASKSRPFYRPEDEEWMLGQCAAYAEGPVRLNPELVPGIHWRLSKPGDDDYDEEGLQDDPRYETGEIDVDNESTWPPQRWPEHYFAHDAQYAYGEVPSPKERRLRG